MVKATATTGTRPRGPWRQRMLDWAGSITVMAGATCGGLAFVFLHDYWLWAAAGALIVAGLAVWISAGPAAASRHARSYSSQES